MSNVAPEESGDLTEADPLVGATLNERYEVVRRLDAGGMGSVYEARHLTIEKRVVIKVLHDEFAREEAMVERFKREARAATSIGNEHIVDVTDLGELRDGSPFIVMEYLDGLSLGHLIEEQQVLRVSRAIKITRQVCDALAAAHRKGIVHRDMKPDNVFLVRRGRDADFVKVLDFGISKIKEAPGSDSRLTKTGVAMGTPAYMAPEQAQGLKSLDHRADIFAVGVMLFETLAGRLPFEADTYAALLLRMMMSEAPLLTRFRADVPAGLAAIVHRCMEKLAVDRPATMVELSAMLEPFESLDVEPLLVGACDATRPTDRPTQLEHRASTEPQGAHDPSESMRPPSLKETEPSQPALTAREAVTEAAVAKVAVSEAAALEAAAVTEITAPTATARSLPAWIFYAGAALIVAGVGAWWALSSPPEPVSVAQEVRLRIRVAPADAVIELDGTTFPNPMDAARPRSLTPVTLHIVRDGFRAMERTIVLDRDRSYDFELAELAGEERGSESEPGPEPESESEPESGSESPSGAGETADPPRSSGRRGGTASGRGTASTEPPREEPPPEPDPPATGDVYEGRRGGLREDF